MTDQQDDSTAQPQGDDAELTRRHDLPDAAGVERYSPQAEPQPAWTRHDLDPAPAPTTTTERWYEPAPTFAAAPVAPAAASVATSNGRNGR